jgi:hypothetical protein
MGYDVQVVFGFECTMFVGYLAHSATFASQSSYNMKLIWIVDFKFSAYEVETTYIPLNRM